MENETNNMAPAPPWKLLAIDVDGTTLREGHESASPRVANAIRAASKLMRVAFVTGRSIQEVRSLCVELELQPAGHVLGGGAFLWDTCGSLEPLAEFAPSDVDFLGVEARRYGYPLWLLGRDGWFQATESVEERASAAFMIAGPLAESLELAESFKSSWPAHFALSVATGAEVPGRGLIHIGAQSADKGSGLRALLRKLALSRDDVISVGDMTNDLQMFRASGFSIAMGSAPASVKATASAVTATAEEDGLAEAIEKYILRA